MSCEKSIKKEKKIVRFCKGFAFLSGKTVSGKEERPSAESRPVILQPFCQPILAVSLSTSTCARIMDTLFAKITSVTFFSFASPQIVPL